MSLTKALNSKSNIKQYSSADLPVIPRQPVINRYSAESTANQTVINLPFSIDTINAPEVLLLSVDGKLLTPGSTNDFTFTAIDGFGFSNQVTLTQSISAGLNIQAIKLGLKKETEFVQDQRFNDVYSSLNEGFQGFVATSSMMSATTTTGTPVDGQFYSTVVNRAPIVDLRNDLKARMGIDRMPVQQIYPIQTEFGPNGEQVWGVVNDNIGLVRFVGAGWTNINGVNGISAGSTLVGDSCEITFYGTGLNLLILNTPQSRIASITVDGVSVGNFTASLATSSGVLVGRNYSPNVTANVVSGLSLGVHTVKITMTTNTFEIFGFEILNEASTIKVQPGTSYIQGKKLSNQAQQSLAYDSVFESGSLGTKGGRVVVYQKADGTIAKAVQPVDASSAVLTSANHANEEVARVYNWREFGAGRTDDFSIFTSPGATSLAFVLDDNVTTLTGYLVNYYSPHGNLHLGTNNCFVTITFVGTGLDLIQQDHVNGGADNYQYSIDGATAVTFQTSGNTAKRTTKIVSGLPYGTHTVRISRVTATTFNIGIHGFIVYQPKKPTLPSGAVELADYNVVAIGSPNATAGMDTMATGVLRKFSTREFIYSGTWTLTGPASAQNYIGLYQAATNTNGGYVEYTFFGNGFELRGQAFPDKSTNASVTLNGLAATVTNFPSLVSSVYGGWTFSSGTLTQNAASQSGAGLSIRDLPLGLYRLRVTNNVTSQLNVEALDVFTPIHSAKSNTGFDQQNTMLIGSQSIMDTRKTTAIKESNLQVKNISQAVGVTSSPSTTSTTLVPVPDLSVTHYNKSGRIKISYSMTTNGTPAVIVNTAIFVDGVSVKNMVHSVNSGYNDIVDLICLNVFPGYHKIDIHWSTASNSLTAINTSRLLLVEEV